MNMYLYKIVVLEVIVDMLSEKINSSCNWSRCVSKPQEALYDCFIPFGNRRQCSSYECTERFELTTFRLATENWAILPQATDLQSDKPSFIQDMMPPILQSPNSYQRSRQNNRQRFTRYTNAQNGVENSCTALLIYSVGGYNLLEILTRSGCDIGNRHLANTGSPLDAELAGVPNSWPISCGLGLSNVAAPKDVRYGGIPAAGGAGVGIALSHRAEVSLLDWIPVDSRLCAVHLAKSVKESHKRKVDGCLFIVSVYAPTDCSSDAVKDSFYDALNALLRRAKSSDIVMVAGDMSRHGLDSLRTDSGERLLQLRANRRLFLCSTNFRNSRSRLATWCPPTTGRPQTQIDHVAISYRWRGSITDCRSFWNTFVDSDHALVRSRFSLRFPGSRKVRTNRMATERLADPDVRRTYKNRLLESLPSAPPSDVNSYWDEIATSLHSAGNFACGTTHPGALKHWISDRMVALLKSRRNIPTGPEHNPMRRAIRRQVKLIRATGPRKPPVSESIKHQDGTTISNKEERLDRWAEYFEQQMSGPPAGTHLWLTGEVEPWTVSIEPPTASEFTTNICSLKRHRAPGPDNLPPALLRMPNHRLPKRVMFSMPNSEWRKQRGGQPLTWQRSMKEITKRLGAVSATRRMGWEPRDPHCARKLSTRLLKSLRQPTALLGAHQIFIDSNHSLLKSKQMLPKQLHTFRNRSPFSRDARRIYKKKTYYWHASPSAAITFWKF
ncbi:hypothetical protein T265_11584 [Opisthorchis viverrini]|uniref:Endonuclease/exonuclease/phosphatase domain-containing protein n=1 Tax=Opisthorchis viverrini TaxID=6198 RepID=A0A074Z913_OPIVI|nr:hypothetical protein T265_11584 [Opisthorchis viverrini]KER19715.1 hypothetical protein T265_11584 [Opisthorchis viverrini]